MSEFVGRYGRWEVVAGASEGIGTAFARSLAQRGVALLLIARQERLPDDLAAELRDGFGVETRCLVVMASGGSLRSRGVALDRQCG